MAPATWLAAIEGFYGRPFSHDQRLDLIRWLPSAGFTDYAYGPKDDPYHRDDWRTPYPDAHLDRFRETVATGRDNGVEVTLSISPGLDWHGDVDDEPLAAKLRQLYDVGARSLGVYWDDVPPGGEDLGRRHGTAVAAAMKRLPADVRWLTVGTDYATDRVTAYLHGFADELPAEVAIAWTGPAVTSPDVPAELARALTEELGHALLFCDNWPVNDLGMAPVLHLGPAPYRESALRDAVAGAGFNMMSLPLASRPALALAARHWRDPAEDRETAWRDVLSGFPGLLPLARAARSWLADPGPDPELLSWVEPTLAGDKRLVEFLLAGCRDGLPPEWQAELEPWLQSWEAEAAVMTGVLAALTGGDTGDTDLVANWLGLHRMAQQTFGIRFAVYGLTYRAGDRQLPHPASVVRGENLTDILVRTALETMYAATHT